MIDRKLDTHVTTSGGPAMNLVVVPLEEVGTGVLLLKCGVDLVDDVMVLVLGGEEANGDADLLGIGDVDEPAR